MATTDYNISPIKRERQNRTEKLRRKQFMRTSLPVLSKREIRRFRLPYHEAILKELEEDDYLSSATFLKQLIDFQEELREEHGLDSVVSSRPRLLTCKEIIDILCDGLKKAEDAHYAKDYGTECDQLIKMGAKFALGSSDWWWLGEQLLMQAVSSSSEFRGDGSKKEAIAKYIYGKYLIENLRELESGKELLVEARQLSTGKSWNAKQYVSYKHDSIFIDTCLLLHKVLLEEARDLVKIDPLRAARICTISRKRAADACYHEGEADAWLLKGLCEMEAGDASTAIHSFQKVLGLHTKANKIEGICEILIYLSLAYQKIGNYQETMTHLQRLLELAQLYNMEYYIAQAHRFLGEYHISQGQPSDATPLLIKALNIFHSINDIPNREQVRNLAAISAGQELIAKYIDLILKCDSPSAREEIMKLVRWKDSRELFWAEEEEQISVKEYDDKTVRLSSESQAMDIEVHSLPTEEDENADDRRDSIFVQGDIF